MMKIFFLMFAGTLSVAGFCQHTGIGTATPTEKLEIRNALRSTVKINSGSYTDTTQLLFSNTTDDGTGTDFSLRFIRERGLFLSTKSDLAQNTNDSIMIFSPRGRVGIGGESLTASAIVEIKSTTRGFLLPKMTTSQRNSIASPVAGLQVFDSDTESPWYYKSTGWQDQAPLVKMICMGNVSAAGSITLSGSTPNFTVSRPLAGTYLITITGENYQFFNYTAYVTAVGSTPRLVSTSSGSGNLQIYIADATGTKVDEAFQFVVYKK